MECTVTNADLVVVGTVVEIGNGSEPVTLTLAVEATLKGEHRDRLQLRLPAPGLVLAAGQDKGRAARLLVATKGDPPAVTQVIDLSGERLEVLRADFTLLKEPEDVIRAATRAIRRMPGVWQIETFRRVVPGRGRGRDALGAVTNKPKRTSPKLFLPSSSLSLVSIVLCVNVYIIVFVF